MSFSADGDNHPVAYAGWDLHFDDLFAVHDTFTAAFFAFVFDDGAFSAARRTHGLGLHHSEDALLGLYHEAAAMACGAGFRGTTSFRTASVTVRASDLFLDFELFSDPCGYFL